MCIMLYIVDESWTEIILYIIVFIFYICTVSEPRVMLNSGNMLFCSFSILLLHYIKLCICILFLKSPFVLSVTIIMNYEIYIQHHIPVCYTFISNCAVHSIYHKTCTPTIYCFEMSKQGRRE